MHRLARLAVSGVAVLGLAAGLLAIGTAVGAPPPTSSGPAATAAAGDPLAQRIAGLQRSLDRIPDSYRAWSDLGYAYLEQTRVTADPALYGRAQGAFEKAQELRPDDDTSLAGLAALAAARHDFAGALRLTDSALAVNDFSPTTYAVRTDALVELGRYDDALVAVQRLLDLQPGGVDALTRGSYAEELRGSTGPARELLHRAAESAVAPSDVAFAQYYLGELAFHEGDLDAAAAAYDRGLSADPTALTLVGGRAKVLAAQGDTAAAASEYRRVVERLPQPEFLVALGELLEASGQQDAAQEQYDVVRATQQLYAANGQDVDTELALFEADHGTPAAAVGFAQKAYATRPDAILTQDAYAWALHAAGRSAEALPIARRAVRLGLRSPSLYYHLGAIEAAAGNRAAAVAALEKSLALNPAFNPLHAPKAQALLESLR